MVGGELKTRLTIIVYVFFTRYFSKRPTRIDVLLINVPASALFTADSKFLTSFLTITFSIVTWCRPYISFLFNFGTTSSVLSSFNRELKQRRSTHVTFLLLIVLIERFARKFSHHQHTARQNTAEGCKKNALSVEVRPAQNVF